MLSTFNDQRERMIGSRPKYKLVQLYFVVTLTRCMAQPWSLPMGGDERRRLEYGDLIAPIVDYVRGNACRRTRRASAPCEGGTYCVFVK